MATEPPPPEEVHRLPMSDAASELSALHLSPDAKGSDQRSRVEWHLDDVVGSSDSERAYTLVGLEMAQSNPRLLLSVARNELQAAS